MALFRRKATSDERQKSCISPVQSLLPQLKEGRHPRRKRYRLARDGRTSGPQLVAYLADCNSSTTPSEAQRRADVAHAGRVRIAFVAVVLAIVWVWFHFTA